MNRYVLPFAVTVYAMIFESVSIIFILLATSEFELSPKDVVVFLKAIKSFMYEYIDELKLFERF